ncbi:hypothetical protein [Caldinitratiruptor microaerophilus]|uniref:Uncharacterized protein n=1 Tax=Caldinitratiruptor microaerophilus TaxID=671077 RepID=A0AA35G5E0_9FIRM|nr:hypothetical protein [Caldinitratiruptor microaerophilus]BDG59221.1 hypothetical protein caldi_03110 [Caldinitratiruptor microaerophilus]
MPGRRRGFSDERVSLLLPVLLVALLARQVPRLQVRTLLEILRFILDRMERG